jgi:exopolyphosphatase/guanosine-5'-triphosphate,3'-diphosphate pyrophosphatase
MPGFTDTEREFVATLCRYHRKALPSTRHNGFQSLSAETRRAITLLIPLLRLADSLDRGHRQDVCEIECQSRDGGYVLLLRGSGDTDLEQWAAERASDVFRQVYERPLTIARARR